MFFLSSRIIENDLIHAIIALIQLLVVYICRGTQNGLIPLCFAPLFEPLQMLTAENKKVNQPYNNLLQASGDVNKLIHIWDGDGLQLVHTFKGHRQAVSVSNLG